MSLFLPYAHLYKYAESVGSYREVVLEGSPADRTIAIFGSRFGHILQITI